MNEFLCLELRLKTEIDHIKIIRMINVYDEKRQLIISIQKQNTRQTETDTQKILYHNTKAETSFNNLFGLLEKFSDIC